MEIPSFPAGGPFTMKINDSIEMNNSKKQFSIFIDNSNKPFMAIIMFQLNDYQQFTFDLT
jgi:hypothetical protein